MKNTFTYIWERDRLRYIQRSLSNYIKEAKAKKAVKCLRSYGILLDQGNRCRTHRTIQAIIRWKLQHDPSIAAKKRNKNFVNAKEASLKLLETLQVHGEGNSKKLIIEELRFSTLAHCHALMKHLTDDQQQQIRLLHVMSQANSQTYLKNQCYLSPQATQGGDLHRQVIEFIKEKDSHFSKKKKFFSFSPYTPMLLIQGDAGTGKSTYATYLVQQLWEVYLTSIIWAHIPLFISLPEFCKEGDIPSNLIELVLEKKGLNEATIEAIKKEAQSGKQPWVFIFDGYDEIHGKKNLFTHCKLAEWGVAYSKYIITCRTTYLAGLGENKKKRYFKDHQEQAAQELTIAPYATSQIEKYVKKFGDSPYNLYKDSGKDATWYQKELAKLPALKDFMTTPFLLVIGMQALPNIVACQEDNPNAPLSQYTIYEAFTKEWLKREANKPQQKVTQESLRAFCEELAYELYQRDTSMLQKDNVEMDRFFKDSATLQSAPLRYEQEGYYRFIHPSFQYFFAALFIMKNKKLYDVVKRKLLSSEMIHFLVSSAMDKNLQQKLWNYVHKKQQSDATSIVATNSLHILCCAGHKDFSGQNLMHIDFRGLDLQGIDLRKAKLPQNLSGANLTDAKLPQDLSRANLTDTNLTRQKFTSTNLEGTKLSGVILTDTLCDYQKCFATNGEKNQLSGGDWYRKNLLKDLQSIARVYPHLSKDIHKAELLQIASGLAYLPYYERTEFYIKISYYSCKLLLLKKQLKKTLGDQLVCSVIHSLEYDAKNYCWQTNYPENKVEEEKEEAPHADFDKYLKTFREGLKKYNVKSKDKDGFKYYKENIEKNIQGLQKAYPKLTSPALKKEATSIAFLLSKSWQIQHLLFLFRYLFAQNRLIRLSFYAGVGVKNDIHYRFQTKNHRHVLWLE